MKIKAKFAALLRRWAYALNPETPATLPTASGFTILRNGKPITDDQIGKFRDKPLTRSVKYSAVVTVGGVTATIGI